MRRFSRSFVGVKSRLKAGCRFSSFVSVAQKKELEALNCNIFFLGWKTKDLMDNAVAIYNPRTNNHLLFDMMQSNNDSIRNWLREEKVAGKPLVFFPFQEDRHLAKVADDLLSLELPEAITIARDAWTLVYSTFVEFQRSLAGLQLPKSIESAYYMLAKKEFNHDDDATLRSAKLSWETLLTMYHRLGSGGNSALTKTSTKPLPPLQQLIRFAFRPIRIFTIAIEKSVTKSVIQPAEIKIQLYHCASGGKTSYTVPNFVKGSQLFNLASRITEPNTVTLLFLAGGTSQTDVSALLRGIHQRCPILIADPKRIVNKMGLNNVGESPLSFDAGEAWQGLLDRYHLKEKEFFEACEYYALQRVGRNAINAALTRHFVNLQQDDAVSQLINEEKVGKSAAFVNPKSVRVHADVSRLLDEWRAVIYNNDQRTQSETAELKHYERYLVLDFETTTKRTYKRTANPFDPDNYIVLPGFADYKGNITIPEQYYTGPNQLQVPNLDGYDVIVGHNIKFDLLHFWKNPELKRFIKRGGRIWDTMYAEYLLTGQMVRLGKGAGLDDVARGYGGQIEKLDEVKQAWAQGKDTTEIPHKVLAKYLTGDLKNTELIFKKQRERALLQKQVIIVGKRMDGLLCTTEMEFNGLKIDLKCAETQSKKIAAQLAVLKKSMDDTVPDEVPRSMKKYFNWASNSHLAALFFGGTFTLDTYTRCVRGTTMMTGPPTDVSCAAQCAFVSGQGFVPRSTKLHKVYFDPYLRAKGFRPTIPVAKAFADLTSCGSYIPFIFALESNEACVEVQDDNVLPLEKIQKVVLLNLITDETQVFDSSNFSAAKKYLDGAAKGHAGNLLLHDCATINSSGEVLRKLLSLGETDIVADLNMIVRFAVKSFDFVPRGKEIKPSTNMVVGDAEKYCLKKKQILQELVKHVSVEKWRIDQEDARKTLSGNPSKDAKKKKIENVRQAEMHMAQVKRLAEQSKPDVNLKNPLSYTSIFGLTCATAYDCFYVKSVDASKVAITLPGRLQTLYLDEGKSDAEKQQNQAKRKGIIEKFTSVDTKKLQVGVDTLTFFAKEGDSLGKTIIELRAMEKLLGTYYDADNTGMVSLVHSHDNCIHHELQHNKTSTGRLASVNPNCQNIPKEDKSELREMFISRFDNGMCLEADYSQLEVITLCALSRDPEMTKDIVRKVDFHCKRVTMMRPELTYDEVFQKAKKLKLPDFVKMRSQAKVFSFQRQYGAGVKTLSQSTGLTPDEVRTLIENEKETYPEVENFAQLVTLSVHQYNTLLQDGARNIKGDHVFKGSFPVITGSVYVFTEQDLPEAILQSMTERGEVVKTTNFSPTQLKNYPVQGFAGEIVQIMLGELFRHFSANENYGGKALLTNTVHDCVWVDCLPEVLSEVAKDTSRILSSARAVLNKLWPDMRCEVEFPVDVVVGKNMGDTSPLN